MNPEAPFLTRNLEKKLASFRKEVIESHCFYVPGLKRQIIKKKVEVITIGNLLDKHGFWDANLVIIDVERYESEVLTGIDFQDFKPKIIYFENKHMGMNEYEGIETRLSDQGYSLFKTGRDSYAINDFNSSIA